MSVTKQSLSALVFGGTGGIGRQIVYALAKCPDFSKVTLVNRREIQFPQEIDGKWDKITQKVVNFDQLSDHVDLFKGHDIAFDALGSNNPRLAEPEMRKVEIDLTLELAKFVKESGVKEFHYISGTKADKHSWRLYARVKAEIEEGIVALGFRRVVLYRAAAILLADRPPSIRKVADTIAANLDIFKKHTINSELFGRVVVAQALKPKVDNGVEIIESHEINRIGGMLLKI